MRQIKLTAIVCLLSSAARAQPIDALRGEDMLTGYMRRLLISVGLPGQIYVGGGSTAGVRALINARTDIPSQRLAPTSRRPTAEEVDAAAANNLRLVDSALGFNALAIHINDAGNATLRRLRFSDAQKIWQCTWTSWAQVPGSERTDTILPLALDERQTGTGFFVSSIGGFLTMPSDSWWNNYPCVNVCFGDGCTQIIGSTTAAVETAIGYTGLPGLRQGNRDLALCNDTNPPGTCSDGDYVFQSLVTIRDESYPLSRKLHMYQVAEITGDPFRPQPPRSDLLVASVDPSIACPILAGEDFVSVESFCP